MPEETKPVNLPATIPPAAPSDQVLSAAIETEGGHEVWPTGKALAWASCLSLETEDDKAFLVQCQMKADAQVADRLKEWIPVAKWFAHKIELRNLETGEVREATRLVLVDPKGETFSTCSASFANGWRWVLQAYGVGPYTPPLLVMPYEVKSSNNPGGYFQFKIKRDPQGETESIVSGGNPDKPAKSRRNATATT